jgi:hypothetical protein
MKGPDIGAVWTAGQDWVLHSWPVVTSSLAIGATIWKLRRWIAHTFAWGVEREQLVRDLDDAQAQFQRSERVRSSMREMVDDLTRAYNQLEDDLREARDRLAEIDAMLEIRTANEWMLFRDREGALAWGRDCAERLRAAGGTPPPEPEMMGVPVAEPDELVTERFHREREDLIRRYERPHARDTASR